ncbi:hypothetical protein F4810DRAFT_675335 [Camillea tinctor]|nr:hypothetical protein F4810DRAFT_675335 [Camillea tinctor]
MQMAWYSRRLVLVLHRTTIASHTLIILPQLSGRACVRMLLESLKGFVSYRSRFPSPLLSPPIYYTFLLHIGKTGLTVRRRQHM